MSIMEKDIKDIWKSSKTWSQVIGKEEINKFKDKKSRSVYSELSKTALIQLFQKVIYGIALFFGLFIFNTGESITLAVLLLFIINVVLIISDFRELRKIKYLQGSGDSVLVNLKKLQLYLQNDFFIYRFTTAFSNPLLIITGILYYLYFKYGKFNLITEPDSIIVFGIIILISYLIGYVGISFSSGKVESEIRSYIEIIEDPENYDKIISKDRRQRSIRLIVMGAVLIAGIVLFLVILIS